MRILVTGASGFIGGRFARFALEQGLDVRVNGRRAEGVEHLVKRGAHFMPGDLGDARLARRVCQGVDVVVHCAGMQGQWGGYQALHHANVVTTENIVEGSLKEHVRRLVYVSSSAVYGTGQHRIEIPEEPLPRRLRGPQALTRFLAEQKVFGAQEFGLETLVVRPHRVTGAGDAGFFPHLMQRHRKRRLAIIGNGLNRVDFTSVHNLNEALLAAVFAEEQALGQVYNLSNGQPLPLWDVVNYVMRQMGMPPVTRYCDPGLAYGLGALSEVACRAWPGRPQPSQSRHEVQALSQDFTLDISRARQRLDYRPQVSLWAALDEFCTWWKGQGGQ
ncbi:NAD-dependent epimerase/dehydratase family protein [Pseudomonas alabamensis]|uniref:NAD-dependent epimerase/dehydratase family protein n=1 Tax=Pseudomonas alabamensis TaxID=3064349 RepID=UPI0021D7E5EF|nr:NAD-dependent epimerase/dehydratase family protein [Pseudomonas entomophila]